MCAAYHACGAPRAVGKELTQECRDHHNGRFVLNSTMPDFHRGFGSTTMAQMAASHFPSSPTLLAVHARYREALGCGVGAVEPGADLVAPGAGLLGGPSYIARQALPASTWHSWHGGRGTDDGAELPPV